LNNKIISTSSLNTEKIGTSKKRKTKTQKDLRANLESSRPYYGYSSHDEATIDFIGRSGGLRDQIAETTIALQKDPNNPSLITKSINLENQLKPLSSCRQGY
jgi:hypothetical protein